MKADLQKASAFKRASAWLFDMIILVTVIVGVAFLLSFAVGYDGYNDRLSEIYESYGERYGVSLDITEEEYNALDADARKTFDEAFTAVSEDDEASYTYTMIVNLTLVIISVSVLIGYVGLEFVVPLIFGNGMTFGKKIFGIAVMRTDGVKINGTLLFIRTVLGKYTIETMIPVFIVIMIYFNMLGLLGTVILGLILLLQIILVLATATNSPIHDLIASTVAVDYASQKIFSSGEEMLEYKKKLHAEEAARKEY